jgi:hypothetical protein
MWFEGYEKKILRFWGEEFIRYQLFDRLVVRGMPQ